MTEKRFTIKNYDGVHYDVFDKEYSESNELAEVHKEDAQNLCNLLNELHEENMKLKKELKDYHNAFDCSQCRYHNYNWFDDGDEFEVCDKGNDEAQMDNHSCKDWEEL